MNHLTIRQALPKLFNLCIFNPTRPQIDLHQILHLIDGCWEIFLLRDNDSDLLGD